MPMIDIQLPFNNHSHIVTWLDPDKMSPKLNRDVFQVYIPKTIFCQILKIVALASGTTPTVRSAPTPTCLRTRTCASSTSAASARLSYTDFDLFVDYQGNDTSTYRYLCNHRRAYKFFTDSISPKCYFTSFPCENYDKFQAGECFDCNKGQECGRLGYYSNQAKGRGSLYMLTRDEEPFCGTQYMVNILFSRSRGPVQTYGKLQLMLVDKNGINETFTVTK